MDNYTTYSKPGLKSNNDSTNFLLNALLSFSQIKHRFRQPFIEDDLL